MKLLIVTQVVDTEDPVLGFFHAWIEEFAKNIDQVTVICLREGKHDLPPNVRIYSLGKERKRRPGWMYALTFIGLTWKLREQYDAVFVHMNPEYLVLAGWLWRIRNVRTMLWYTHKNVDVKLRIGTRFASVICTASKESFLLPTKKLHVMGHGIDSKIFSAARIPSEGTVRLITIGRISPTKRIREMLDVCEILHSKGTSFMFTVIGAPATPRDKEYEADLLSYVQTKSWKKAVTFLGPAPHSELPKHLASADIFLNLSQTGSLDKAVLEAVLAGVVPITSNPAFREQLEGYGLFVETAEPEGIVNAILHAQENDLSVLREEFAQKHSLFRLIPAILSLLRR